MINLRLLPAVLALTLAGGCAPSAGPVASPSVAPVPAGCEPTPDRLTWSPSSTSPMLTDATLYVSAALGDSPPSTMLLDQPFTPSVVGIAAPDSWTAELAESLQRTAGLPVHAASPAPSPSSLSFGSEAGTAYVIYAGVERVTAGFEVRCAPPVTATFHGWSKAVSGVVFCRGEQSPEPDAYGRLALELCPEPAPEPSATS